MMYKYAMALVLSVLMASACQPPAAPAPTTKQPRELHFPFDQPVLEQILIELNKYPVLKEFGYVFTDHQMLNDDMVVFKRSQVTGFPVQVHWIDYREKKYVEKDYYPVYYTELISKLGIKLEDFEHLRRKMTAAYVEGVINQPDRKYFFLNTKMGTYQGFLYTPMGRKGLDDTFMMNDIEVKIVKELGKNWFGFAYP